jgi:[ribosomal protein S5]-alanine N-acetyltransferase
MKDINIPTNTILKTKRLLLRYPELKDTTQIFCVVKSPQFPEQLPLKEMNAVSEIEDWLKRLQEGWAKGQVFSWIVEDCDSGKMLGQVTLSKVEGDSLWAMAFWTHPDHWGKGYATEGAKRILAFGFEVIGAEKIWAGAGEWNKGSCRVLEKIGMKYMGDDPKGYYSKGEPIATREYEISRKRWQK